MLVAACSAYCHSTLRAMPKVFHIIELQNIYKKKNKFSLKERK